MKLKELLSFPKLQKKLFDVAVKLLKPGGHLVYSTCSITRGENEDMVDWACEKFQKEIAQVKTGNKNETLTCTDWLWNHNLTR